MGLVKTWVHYTRSPVAGYCQLTPCNRYHQLLSLRVLLGIAEAGLPPGAFYL